MTGLFHQLGDLALAQRDVIGFHEAQGFPHCQRQAIEPDHQFRDDLPLGRSPIGRVTIGVEDEPGGRSQQFDVGHAGNENVRDEQGFDQRHLGAAHSAHPAFQFQLSRPTVQTPYQSEMFRDSHNGATVCDDLSADHPKVLGPSARDSRFAFHQFQIISTAPISATPIIAPIVIPPNSSNRRVFIFENCVALSGTKHLPPRSSMEVV